MQQDIFTFFFIFFFFNDTATTEIYTLSLHDALPISGRRCAGTLRGTPTPSRSSRSQDRKSTRLNSSHTVMSYAVFCLKKKKRENGAQELEKNCNDCSPIQSFELLIFSIVIRSILFGIFIPWCFAEVDFFFFNDTATTEIYTLSLHDALPILLAEQGSFGRAAEAARVTQPT